MSRSRKKNPTNYADAPKGTWKRDYNSALRNKSNQLIKQVINGKLDPDELIMPNVETVSDIWTSPKENARYYPSNVQHKFSEEHPEDEFLEDLECREKAFRK